LFLKSPPTLILASTSAYRRELLGRLRVPFSCAAPGVDETRRAAERPLALAVRLARAKASVVALAQPNAWVIGSDQVAVRVDAVQGEMILGKPGTAARCAELLRGSSGQLVTYLTAVAVLRHDDGSVFEFVDTTRVRFRTLEDATIERYVALEAPFDCAGGLKSEALGITLCESIETSDPSALMGLPLIQLSAVLRGAGFLLP
jgi:septum formation protein